MNRSLFSVQHPDLTVKMVTTAYDGMTVSYIRQVVFIHEQKVPLDLEFDGSDAYAISFLFFLKADPIGTVRYYRDEQGIFHIGRVALLKKYRGQGFGKIMMVWLHDYLKSLFKSGKINIHAQLRVQAFYQQLGYQPIGTTFMEANIPHIEMELTF
jgi:predicted GNAT family N-acyltransferase